MQQKLQADQVDLLGLSKFWVSPEWNLLRHYLDQERDRLRDLSLSLDPQKNLGELYETRGRIQQIDEIVHNSNRFQESVTRFAQAIE